MSRRLRALVALAALAVAASAYAFVRSTTAQNNPGSGVALWWRPRQIAYVVNASAYHGGCSDAAAAASAARASFPAWMNASQNGTQACTDFEFNDCGDTTTTALGNDGVNLVVFRSTRCALDHASDPVCTGTDLGACIEKYNCWSHDNSSGAGGIIALTTITFDSSSGEIIDADMELHGWDGNTQTPTGFFFTCVAGPACTVPYPVGQSCAAFDVQNTVTHEAGHMLGLDHICDSSNPAAPPFARQCPTNGIPTMAPTAALGDIDKRTLAPDDIQGVCSIYPAGQATVMATGTLNGDVPTGATVAVAGAQACPSGAKASSSGGGCSTGAAGAWSLLAVALGLWSRRRRS